MDLCSLPVIELMEITTAYPLFFGFRYPTLELAIHLIDAERTERVFQLNTYFMSLGRVLQRIRLVDPDIELLFDHQAKEFICIFLILLTSIDVAVQRRSHNLGVFRRQFPMIEEHP